MATKPEKEALESIQKDLALVAVGIVKQSEAVTDRTTRVRIARKAQDVWAIVDRIGALVES
jgi:hypothetical protein